MDRLDLPLVLRGCVLNEHVVCHRSRHGELELRAPDAGKYLDRLVLRNPLELSELYCLSIAEILDYLQALGERLRFDRNAYLQQALDVVLHTSHQTKEMSLPAFQAIHRMFARDAVLELIERNIGVEFLEGWVTEKQSDRDVAVRAFGARAVHVIAGNGPVVGAHTIVMNAVTRSDAIIKLPSNDPCTALAIVRTMVDMAPDHPLTRHVSAAYWKGGDDNVERALYDARHIEKIVAWGGFNSMRSIRKYLAPGIDLVALDPKVSGTLIGKDAFADHAAMQEAAGKLAFDIGHFNQSGCVNAKVVCIETGTDEIGIGRANEFGQLVFDALQALPTSVSSVHPNFDPVLKAEIDGIRYSEDFRVFGGKQAEGAIIVSQFDEEVSFSERLDCRVANLIPVDDIPAALRHITIHTQTLGVYPDALKARVRDEFALRGGQRVVSLGFATAATLVGPWDAMEHMRRVVRWVRDDTVNTRSGYLFA